jgi:hypothetical protein
VKLRDLANRVVVPPRQLTEYALNAESERGRHKARVFEAVRGDTRDNAQALLEQIEAQALDTEAVVQRTDIYGQHVRVDLEIEGGAGQQAVVRTGWLVAPGSDEAQLITLYVKEGSG